MAKLVKIIGKILGSLLEWVLLFLIFFAFAIRTSQFQTFLAQQVAHFFAKEWNTTVHIDKIDVVFFDKVYLNGLYVQDLHKDTLAYVHEVEVNLLSYNLVNHSLNFSSGRMTKGVVKLRRYEKEEHLNFQFIVDYFKSDKPSSPSPNFHIKVKSVALQKIHFIFDLADKNPIPRGMDYAHLDIDDIWLSISNFSSKNGQLKARINSLKAREKGGFVLYNLKGYAQVSGDSIYLKKAYIKTPKSSINLPSFAMITGTYGNFKTFIDSVAFRARLNKSFVSMEDIVQFAPVLWGMDEMVTISANVTQKVKDLKITNLMLSTGKTTKVIGSVQLPDFREMSSEKFNEHLVYFESSADDIQQLRLPDKNNQAQYITLPKELQRMGRIQLEDVSLRGNSSNFSVYCQQALADVAKISFPGGIHFAYNEPEKMYYFNSGDSIHKSIHIDYFDLGRFLDNTFFGEMSGDILVAGKGFSSETFELDKIEGKIDQFAMNGYSYSNITIERGKLNPKMFDGKVSIQDKAISMEYEGSVAFGSSQKIDVNLAIKEAKLDQLNFISIDSTKLTTKAEVHLYGSNFDSYSGTIQLDSLEFYRENQKFAINSFHLDARRNARIDTIQVLSSVLDARIIGKINFKTFASNFTHQFKTIFPAIFENESTPDLSQDEEFEYSFTVKEAQPILDVLTPGFAVAKNTKITGNYSAFASAFNMDVLSDFVRYDNVIAKNINLHQDVIGSSIDVDYNVGQLNINDSLQFSLVHFNANGVNNLVKSSLNWGKEGDTNPGSIDWTTQFEGTNEYLFNISKGYFNMKNHQWNLVDSSSIEYKPNLITVDNLKLEHEQQIIALDGRVSDIPSDKLNILIKDLDLEDISALFGSDTKLAGIVNGEGAISTPFTDLSFEGGLKVSKLYVNKNEVGDINFKTNYVQEKRQFTMDGQLFYRGNESILFQGDYYLDRKENSLDLTAKFDNTNINFVNAFLNPEVVSHIRGIISGKLAIRGTLEKPVVEGKVNLFNAGAKLEMFGTEFGLEGQILADEYGFYINNIPIYDQEGNAGSLVGSVLHNNFRDWNFDLSFNLEDDALNKDPYQTWKPLPLKKFLVMNTNYKEGNSYYGKAYVTGTANIFGYTDNLEITVNATTKKGTVINFPMYGQADIAEENGFIQFVSKDTIKKIIEEKINFSSVALDLNFNVTEDAQLKIIFDENTGDQITSTGNGKIRVGLDQLDQLSIEGVYTVKSGEYNFAMGPVKKNFYIEEGGTVQWTGDPYDAALNLRTYYLVSASLSEVMTNIVTDNNTNAKDLIYCYLDLGGSLSKPSIAFDLAAPRASESGKTTLNRIKSTQDELNKQFFSLLLFRKFQPLAGTSTAKVGAGNAAFEVISNQINSVLDKVSKDYKLSVKMNNDETNKQNTYEFGVSKGFLDDRLILSGNFGVNQVNAADKQGTASNFIGDVNLEYKLNESGTFRVNVFNQSNQYDIISKKNLGLFTQGVGLHYQESFSNINDFKLIQFILDLFRKPENRRYLGKKKNKRVPIPKEYLQDNKTIKNEEDSNS